MYDFEKLRIWAENAIDLTSDARARAERCRDYYDGKQVTAAEEAELNRRKQPVVISNRIRRKVDAMVGIEQRGRTDPRALPRGPGDEQAADIATKALVFVDDTTRFDPKRSAAFENLLVEGIGGAEIGVEMRRGRYEVVVTRLRWEEIFYDPYSREKDFSDASFLGCMKWMALDKALSLYGEENEDLLQATMSATQSGETYDDRPSARAVFNWGDKKQRRVRIAQMYYLCDGVWHMAEFTGGGLISNGPSAYLDDDGQPTCPIVLMSGYVDRENNRYGVVPDMIYPQDEVNKRRSKLLHMLNSRQTSGVKGAVNVADLKRELAKPDGHVEVDADLASAAREAGVPAFQILQNQDQISGQASLLTEAKNEIDMVGPNASLIGQLQGDHSGRAIQAQQQAGMVELAPIYDSLRDWTLRCYRQMWMRIKQYWTDERYVRITEDAQAPQFIGLNRIVQFDPMTGAPVMENNIAQMDVDIQIEDAPDYVTLRQEELEQLGQFADRGIPIPPEMLIEASSVRNKPRLLQMMQQQRQQAEQAQAAQAQAEMKIRELEAQAKIMAAQSGAMLDQAQAQKVMAEVPGVAADARASQIKTAAQSVIAARAGL